MSKTSPTTPKGFVTPFLAYLATGIKEYRYIILSTLVAGLAAHLFFLSHKLVTFDDTLFTYGQTISSGRWGLRILTYLMPPFSMPWFHGVISMLLMSAAFVVLVKMFDLRSRLAQVLLPAVIITCAVHTSIFLFMYMPSCVIESLSGLYHIGHCIADYFVESTSLEQGAIVAM